MTTTEIEISDREKAAIEEARAGLQGLLLERGLPFDEWRQQMQKIQELPPGEVRGRHLDEKFARMADTREGYSNYASFHGRETELKAVTGE